MAIRSGAWLMVLPVLAIWLLPGCSPEEAEPVAVAEHLQEEAEPAEVETPEEAIPGEEQADEAEAATEDISEAEARAATQVEIDLERDYPQEGFDHLRAVLWSGRDEHKAEAQRILQTLLLESRRVGTRAMAAGTLAADPAPAVDALRRAALNDPESAVRRTALETLAKAPPSADLIGALEQLRTAADSEVRLTALTTEMELRLRDPQFRADTQWLAEMLSRTRDDTSAQLQIRLVTTGEAVLPSLFEVLDQAADPHARAGAATAIMCISAGTNPQQQRFARLAMAIGQEALPEPQPANLDALEPLERALTSDPAPEVRAIAAQGLGYLGQESSAPLLGAALSDPNEEVRFWAALALETVPGIAAVRDLANTAGSDDSERVRAAAVRALGWVPRERAVVPLISATRDESSMVRQAAAEELGRVRDPMSINALLSLFNDRSEDVRWAAVLAAGKLRHADTIPALVEAMRDPSPMVANAAERALQRMGRAERRFGTLDEI